MTTLESAWILLGQQLRKPAGVGGRLLARAMGLINGTSNRIAIAALHIAANDTVLELGFGTGRAIKAMAGATTEGQVFGIDHSAVMSLQASRLNLRAIQDGRVRLVQGSLDALPWQDGAVDKCLAVHVAYFMGAKEIREARRVLRSGGKLAVLVTDKGAMAHWKFAHPSTHRQFAASDLTKLLLDGGFSREEMCVQRVSLGMGIPGLLALAIKSTA
jgi:SAM-dependent methyltransferase